MTKYANINANLTVSSDDPVWVFLAEFPLSEWLSDHDSKNELTVKYLFQTVRELEIPPECVEIIDKTVTGFIKEARTHAGQGKFGLPESIRIFCQKKMIGGEYSAKSSRPDHSEHAIETAQSIHLSGTKMSGGWGYFLVERSAASAGVSGGLPHGIDLYLYKEGE